MGKSIQKKHQGVFQDHVKYIHNDIVKPIRFRILHYNDRVREMHDLEKYLPPPSTKGGGFESDDWYACVKEFNEDVIQVATKDRLHTSIKY